MVPCRTNRSRRELRGALARKCFTNCPYVPEIKVAKPILIELNMHMQSHIKNGAASLRRIIGIIGPL